jgi:type IV secretion system protein VirD4
MINKILPYIVFIVSLSVGYLFGFILTPLVIDLFVSSSGEVGDSLAYTLYVTHPSWEIVLKMFIATAAMLSAFFIISGVTDKKKDIKNGEKIEEIDNFTVLKELSSKNGFMISKNFRLTINFFKEHILYMGPTGAGKTTSGFIPNLLDSESLNCSVVVNDIKLDIIQGTANRRKELGSEIRLFAPFKPEYSTRINPLLQVHDSSEIRQLAATIMMNGPSGSTNNSDWIDMGKPLLGAIFLAAVATDPNPTIPKCVRTIISMDDDSLARYVNDSGSSEAIDTFSLYKQSAKAPGTAAGIRTVLGACTQLFLDNKVEYLLSGNELDLRDLRRKKITLYIHVPETKIDYAKPLTALIYHLLFSVISAEEGNIVPILLDEFANIGHIPNFQNTISVCRGRGIPLVLGIQSSSQLEEIYGVAAGVILDNLKTKVFFPGMGPNSAEYAAKIIGRKSYKGKLLNDAYIREIPENQVIVISRNKPPVIDESCYYKNDKEMVRMAANEFSIDELYRGPIGAKTVQPQFKAPEIIESPVAKVEEQKQAVKPDILSRPIATTEKKGKGNGFDF